MTTPTTQREADERTHQFRKKPVVIEAFQFKQPTSVDDAPEWLTEAVMRNDFLVVDGVAHITTLEGIMRAKPGDWIIRGVKGEIYPCKPDIFAATYEPARASITPTAPADPIIDVAIGIKDALGSVVQVIPANSVMRHADGGYTVFIDAPAAPQAASQQADIRLEAFKGADTKQWHIVVKHPFGTSWVKMRDPRDIKLAELLAAPQAATTASAAASQTAPEPRNFEISQVFAPVQAAQPALPAEPIGVVGTMPGTDGFTMACFKASEVPVGTKLYLAAPAQADEARDAARLDWIDQQIADKGSVWILPSGAEKQFVQLRHAGHVTNYPTVPGKVREAIDAAIAASLAGKDKK